MPNFQDDINVLGPYTWYKLPDGTYKLSSSSKLIWHFVWEHYLDVNWVLHHLKHASATVSAKKLFVCVLEVIVIGQSCTYHGWIPDKSKVSKIMHWPSCISKTKVCGFLGTTGMIQNWIKDYAWLASPLTNLTHDNTPFYWMQDTQNAMDQLKHTIINSSTIRSIDYTSNHEVILVVDLSYIVWEYILLQLNDTGCHCPFWFGSITWNEHEACYSQAKIKLNGLF